MLNTKTIVIAGAGIAAATGLALAGASMAGADEPSAATATATGYGYGGGTAPKGGESNGNTDPSKPMRSDEQLLTGETADKVTAAAKAKEPDATIERVETDSDGVYEAHMVRSDGTHITVQVDSTFQVTNVIEGGQRGAGGGRKGFGDQSSGQYGQPPAGGQGSQAPSTSWSTSGPAPGATSSN
jgi:hypothetical protein